MLWCRRAMVLESPGLVLRAVGLYLAGEMVSVLLMTFAIAWVLDNVSLLGVSVLGFREKSASRVEGIEGVKWWRGVGSWKVWRWRVCL